MNMKKINFIQLTFDNNTSFNLNGPDEELEKLYEKICKLVEKNDWIEIGNLQFQVSKLVTIQKVFEK